MTQPKKNLIYPNLHNMKTKKIEVSDKVITVPTAELCWDGATHCKFCGEGRWVMCEHFDNNHGGMFIPYCGVFKSYLAYNDKEGRIKSFPEVLKPEICKRKEVENGTSR
jgi:threonine dehydrogenase-like Zn-dependent dehydrogenase